MSACVSATLGGALVTPTGVSKQDAPVGGLDYRLAERGRPKRSGCRGMLAEQLEHRALRVGPRNSRVAQYTSCARNKKSAHNQQCLALALVAAACSTPLHNYAAAERSTPIRAAQPVEPPAPNPARDRRAAVRLLRAPLPRPKYDPEAVRAAAAAAGADVLSARSQRQRRPRKPGSKRRKRRARPSAPAILRSSARGGGDHLNVDCPDDLAVTGPGPRGGGGAAVVQRPTRQQASSRSASTAGPATRCSKRV